MPIEIRELVIRAQVDPGYGTTKNGSNSTSKNRPGPSNTAGGLNQSDMIQTCVQEVLRILEERQER
jgi:hypothetical protein